MNSLILWKRSHWFGSIFDLEFNVNTLKTPLLITMLFISLTSSSAMALGESCIDLFATVEARHQKMMWNRIYPEYQKQKDISELILQLMNQGVRFKFYNPKADDTSSSQLYVEPIVSASWKNGTFDFKNTHVFLPVTISDLPPRAGIFLLKTHLNKMNRIFELQNQGALFSSRSLVYGEATSIIGFDKTAVITDPTLAAIEHLMRNFNHSKVTFESNEAVWDQHGLVPPMRMIKSPLDPNEMWIRGFYIERIDYWEQLLFDFENNIFKYSKPFLRNAETRFQ